MDLYEELIEEQEDAKRQDKEENADLRARLEETEANCRFLMAINRDLEAKYQRQLQNLSSLIKTCRHEINRKVATITALKKQLEEAFGRHLSPGLTRKELELILENTKEAWKNNERKLDVPCVEAKQVEQYVKVVQNLEGLGCHQKLVLGNSSYSIIKYHHQASKRLDHKTVVQQLQPTPLKRSRSPSSRPTDGDVSSLSKRRRRSGDEKKSKVPHPDDGTKSHFGSERKKPTSSSLRNGKEPGRGDQRRRSKSPMNGSSSRRDVGSRDNRKTVRNRRDCDNTVDDGRRRRHLRSPSPPRSRRDSDRARRGDSRNPTSRSRRMERSPTAPPPPPSSITKRSHQRRSSSEKENIVRANLSSSSSLRSRTTVTSDSKAAATHQRDESKRRESDKEDGEISDNDKVDDGKNRFATISTTNGRRRRHRRRCSSNDDEKRDDNCQPNSSSSFTTLICNAPSTGKTNANNRCSDGSEEKVEEATMLKNVGKSTSCDEQIEESNAARRAARERSPLTEAKMMPRGKDEVGKCGRLIWRVQKSLLEEVEKPPPPPPPPPATAAAVNTYFGPEPPEDLAKMDTSELHSMIETKRSLYDKLKAEEVDLRDKIEVESRRAPATVLAPEGVEHLDESAMDGQKLLNLQPDFDVLADDLELSCDTSSYFPTSPSFEPSCGDKKHSGYSCDSAAFPINDERTPNASPRHPAAAAVATNDCISGMGISRILRESLCSDAIISPVSGMIRTPTPGSSKGVEKVKAANNARTPPTNRQADPTKKKSEEVIALTSRGKNKSSGSYKWLCKELFGPDDSNDLNLDEASTTSESNADQATKHQESSDNSQSPHRRRRRKTGSGSSLTPVVLERSSDSTHHCISIVHNDDEEEEGE